MTAARSDTVSTYDLDDLQEERLVRSSLRLKAVLRVSLGLVCVLAWAAFVEASVHEYRQAEEALAQRDANLATAVEHYAVRVLRTARAVHGMLGGMTASGRHGEAELVETLADRLRANDVFQELGLCLADGRVLPQPAAGAALTPAACARFIAHTARGPQANLLAPVRHDGALLAPLTLSLADPQGRFHGVAVALVPTDKMLGIMNSLKREGDRVVALASDDGVVRAAWQAQGAHVQDAQRLAQLGEALRAPAGTVRIEGEPYLVARHDVPQEHLRVFVASSERDAFASYEARRVRFFVLCTLFTAAMAGAYWLLVRLGCESLRRARHLSRARVELQALNTNLDHEVRVRTQQLEQAYRDLETFSYSMAHDVRTPLASISGFAAALEPLVAAAGDDRHQLYLRRIQSSAAHMEALTRRLLQYARISGAEPEVEDVDLSALAEDIVAGLKQAQPERDVHVAIEPGLRVRGDRTVLRQLLENLIGNAWKFSAAQPRTAIAVERGPGPATFVVRDNGVGFDSDTARGLFQPFKRLHDDKQFQGTGLGLATAQRIAALHGGTVSCESKAGEGARFYFTLPGAGAA